MSICKKRFRSIQGRLLFGTAMALLIAPGTMALMAAAFDSADYSEKIGQQYNFLFGKNPYLP
ncbi:MAG TPA: hypothetical protein VKD65_04970, partial [Candidatus Angelobacter sp.]|nr:hypothetical protein [Candidatus Angelobacter sp.]